MDYKRIFSEIILPLKHSLLRYSYSILSDEHKAEDMVQETMIRMWNYRDNWKRMESLEGYCLAVIRNLCLDELKKNQIFQHELHGLEQTPEPENDPMEYYAQKESAGLIRKLTADLPEKQQLCFHLRDIEGRTYEDIAGILHISLDQVKVNIHRARNFIRKQILKEEKYGV